MIPRSGLILEFVTESQKISGRTTDWTDPEFERHIEAASCVVDEGGERLRITSPTYIHGHLMSSGDAEAGCLVPASEGWGGDTPDLNIHQAVETYLLNLAHRLARTPLPSENELMDSHYELLQMSPFRSANGRVARLWLNYLRLVCGYDWLVIEGDAELYLRGFWDSATNRPTSERKWHIASGR